MSMCRLERVKAARKDQGNCGRCRAPIPAGAPYVYWQGRFTGKRVRCLKPGCQPQVWERETNPTKAMALEGEDQLSDAQNATDASTAAEFLNAAMDTAQGILEDLEERISNKEGTAFEQTSEYEALTGSRDAFQSWLDQAGTVHTELETMDGPPEEGSEGEDSQLEYEEAVEQVISGLEEWPELDLGSYGPPPVKRKKKQEAAVTT